MITLKNESQLKSFIKRTYQADKDGVLLLWGREQYRSEFSCILVDGKKVIRQSIIIREVWDDDCYVSYEEKTCNQLIALYIPRKKPNRSQL